MGIIYFQINFTHGEIKWVILFIGINVQYKNKSILALNIFNTINLVPYNNHDKLLVPSSER